MSIGSLHEANYEAVAEAFEAIKDEIATDKKLTEQEADGKSRAAGPACLSSDIAFAK